MHKAPAFFLFLIFISFSFAVNITKTANSSAIALEIYSQVESNATTDAEFQEYLAGHSLISLGGGMDIQERTVLDMTRAANPWLARAEESDDSDATLRGIEGGRYALVILMGGPEQNAISKRAIESGWFSQTIEVEGGFLVESGKVDNTVIIGVSDKKGYESGELKNLAASSSPLAAFIPREYVPLAATGISLGLLILINVGRTVFEFKALNIGRKSKKVGDNAWLFGGINASEALAVLGASLVLGISISWQFYGTGFIGWIIINSLVCLSAAIIHEVTHRIFAHIFNIRMEYRFWPAGSALTLISSYLGNAFSIQGFILEEVPPHTERWKVGLMKLSAPVVSAIVMVVFAYLNMQSPQPLYKIIFTTSGLWAVAEILPFGSLDGKEIRDWNHHIWEAFFILIGGSYIIVTFLI